MLHQAVMTTSIWIKHGLNTNNFFKKRMSLQLSTINLVFDQLNSDEQTRFLSKAVQTLSVDQMKMLTHDIYAEKNKRNSENFKSILVEHGLNKDIHILFLGFDVTNVLTFAANKEIFRFKKTIIESMPRDIEADQNVITEVLNILNQHQQTIYEQMRKAELDLDFMF